MGLLDIQRIIQPVCTAEIEAEAPDVINITYPAAFADRYLRPEIRLEIGPLARWIPNAEYTIRSYVAEEYPYIVFEPPIVVQAIKAERTFWEKATILHQEAFRPLSKLQPPRYSRHYYDLAMMAESDIRAKALNAMDLLESVVTFKRKFYPRAWARYELAKPGSLKLLPPDDHQRILKDDYRKMQAMLYGELCRELRCDNPEAAVPGSIVCQPLNSGRRFRKWIVPGARIFKSAILKGLCRLIRIAGLSVTTNEVNLLVYQRWWLNCFVGWRSNTIN